MATKSFLKTINIKNKKACIAPVNAMENAQNKQSTEVKYDRSYHVASLAEVAKIFEDAK